MHSTHHCCLINQDTFANTFTDLTAELRIREVIHELRPSHIDNTITFGRSVSWRQIRDGYLLIEVEIAQIRPSIIDSDTKFDGAEASLSLPGQLMGHLITSFLISTAAYSVLFKLQITFESGEMPFPRTRITSPLAFEGPLCGKMPLIW